MQDTHDDEPGLCFICLEATPPLVASGCACRGTAALAHVSCRVRAARALVLQKRSFKWWSACPTCQQPLTGEMHEGLARTWWTDAKELSADDREWQEAAANLAWALSEQGMLDDAAKLLRELLAAEQRVFGAEAPQSLSTSGNLALCLSRQGAHAEALQMQRALLEVQTRVLGAEHLDTLSTMGNIAASLTMHAKLGEAVAILRPLLATLQRVLPADEPTTLATTGNLAIALSLQGQHREAVAIFMQLLGTQLRVLGPAHQDTVCTATNLEASLVHMRPRV